MRKLTHLPTCLYRLYDSEGNLLYVGISMDLKTRYEEHRKGKFWWHLVVRRREEWFENRAIAMKEEVLATAREKPVYNGLLRVVDPTLPKPEDPFWKPVARSLRARIEAGEYPIGSKLPGRTALAREYGVSAVSASRALHYVGDLGLIESTLQEGSNVVVSHQAGLKELQSSLEKKAPRSQVDEFIRA